MELIKKDNTIRDTKEFADLLKATFTHKIAESTGTLDWSGPPIPPEVWGQILSFFQWSYDLTHSEAQARLFINPRTRTWVGWVFPQERSLGMQTVEIDGEEKNRQRSALPGAAELIPLGTVHHHCSMGAFQSSGDRHDEKTQDGLHITIGSLDREAYDIHARFSLAGFFFDKLDLSVFWNIGDAVKALIPKSLWDQVARFQMCRKANGSFPEIWKLNLVRIEPLPVLRSATEGGPAHSYQGGLGYSAENKALSSRETGREPVWRSDWGQEPSGLPPGDRIQEAAQDFVDFSVETYPEAAKVRQVVDFLRRSDLVQRLIELSDRWEVSLSDLIDELDDEWGEDGKPADPVHDPGKATEWRVEPDGGLFAVTNGVSRLKCAYVSEAVAKSMARKLNLQEAEGGLPHGTTVDDQRWDSDLHQWVDVGPI
jgi:hypothetical protein